MTSEVDSFQINCQIDSILLNTWDWIILPRDKSMFLLLKGHGFPEPHMKKESRGLHQKSRGSTKFLTDSGGLPEIHSDAPAFPSKGTILPWNAVEALP